MPFIVRPDLCVGCGKCERVCPNGAISVINKKAVINYARCECCGICATECPKNAIDFVPGRLIWGRGRGRGRGRRRF